MSIEAGEVARFRLAPGSTSGISVLFLQQSIVSYLELQTQLMYMCTHDTCNLEHREREREGAQGRQIEKEL